MSRTSLTARRMMVVGGGLILGAAFALSAKSQTAPAAAPPAAPAAASPSPARLAIENRKAVYTLIGNNFKPLGAVLKGSPYDAATIQKSIARLVFLSAFWTTHFPKFPTSANPTPRPSPIFGPAALISTRRPRIFKRTS